MTEKEAETILSDLKASYDMLRKKLDELEVLLNNLLKEKG